MADNPYPSGIKKLEGEDELYRLRVGDYRILYQVKNNVLLVFVVAGMGAKCTGGLEDKYGQGERHL